MEKTTKPTKAVSKLVLTRDEVLAKFPVGMTIAEVGVYRGAYSKRIAESAKPTKYFLIDCWQHVDDDTDYSKLDGCNDDNERHEKNYRWVQRMFRNYPGAELIREFSGPAAEQIADASLDAVYIDGDHTYEGCLADLRAYSKKVKESGFMWGHDYTHTYAWIDVQRAIQTFTAESPEWSLACITAEVPKKSPSWFLTRKGSAINDILATIGQKETHVEVKL